MNKIVQWMEELEQRGIVLSVDEGQLRVIAPKDTLEPAFNRDLKF